ncbi:5-formyltetrahydrofolate cyclo-ligase [Aliidiomarina halalkaliphila]|uniref:5-formyltetrahydrofolate cyclo-ligase n=1 Tax=Aliidiomarina halalkaliphila TaxID=2593535 RepID=UPI00163D4B9C|nr:5-formyltetrahydrofolate cyclo-ligase [Aliidiomarina halalkaliphila]
MTTDTPKNALNAADELSRTLLRKHFRSCRKQIGEAQRAQAEQKILERVAELIQHRGATTIGGYFPNDGEPDLTPLMTQLAPHQRFAVPVLHPFHKNHLLFLRTDQNTPLQPNKFGIPEPACEVPSVVPLAAIHVLLVPLVAFDQHGNRLGMGGGFFDRTLAPWLRGELPHLLPVGVAFDEQQAESLPHAHWDVPLPMIITPSKSWQFSRRDV